MLSAFLATVVFCRAAVTPRRDFFHTSPMKRRSLWNPFFFCLSVSSNYHNEQSDHKTARFCKTLQKVFYDDCWVHFLSTALKHWGAKSTKNCAPLHPLYAFKNHSPKEFQSPSMKILLAFQCFEDCFKFFWEGEQKCFVSHIDLLFFKLFQFKERMFLRLSHPRCEFLHLVCLTYSSVTLPLCRAPVLF